MDSDQIKHLEFIQSVITRLNTNSFQIKGWAITIVAGVIALSATLQNKFLLIIALFSVVLFWVMDGYCLSQERKFRGLYNDVAGISDVRQKLKPFEMNPNLYKGGYFSFWRTLRAMTIWPIYLSILILIGILCITNN